MVLRKPYCPQYTDIHARVKVPYTVSAVLLSWLFSVLNADLILRLNVALHFRL
jgi:hypothetical protein